MIVQSSHTQMSSARKYITASQTSVSTATQQIGLLPGGGLSLATTNRGLGYGAKDSNKNGKGQQNPNGQQGSGNNLYNLNTRFRQTQKVGRIKTSDSLKSFAEIQQKTLDYLMMLFFGTSPGSSASPGSSTGEPASSGISTGEPASSGISTGSSAFSGPLPGLTLSTVNITTCQTELESTSFSTTGTVVTADGRELSFQVDVSMSRSFTQYSSRQLQRLTSTEFCDPLVINLNTDTAEVSDQKFYFDLDADGHEEAISMLAGSSGFLALDKNGDGKINDGSELFGARSGDGFADLAAYDSDGNGWIDEADEIFDKLLIWTKDASGRDVLCGLGKAGVGAIYLGNAATEFSLNSRQDNSTNARIRKTGIFLYENGQAGTIQHVDFAQ